MKRAEVAALDLKRMLVTLTVEELIELIRGIVRDELQEHSRSHPRVLTTAQVAERLGLHPKTVARLVRLEGLPAHRLGAVGEYRFLATEVDTWVAGRGSR
jgi:excisionase family DNA binding protein